MAPLRVVVAGAGLMGRWHIHAARAAGATVVAVVDPDHPRARGLAGTDTSVATELEASLQPEPDVVHVRTPPNSHIHLCHAPVRSPWLGTITKLISLRTRPLFAIWLVLAQHGSAGRRSADPGSLIASLP